jgi:prevent-host-death family protein
MKQVSVSQFKAKCLSIFDELEKTKQPVRVTRRGKPVADVVPPLNMGPKEWMGMMKGKMKILGDIVAPASDPDDWEVLRDENTP